MAETRRDSKVEGRDLRSSLFCFVVWGVLAAAVLTQVRQRWPDEWNDVDPETLERYVLIAGAVLCAISAAWLLVSVMQFARWRGARRWERMLEDPERAHLVPPLPTHLLVDRGGRTSTGTAVAVGMIGLALVVCGLLALLDRIPRPRTDEGRDGSAYLVVGGAVLLLAAVGGRRVARETKTSREVERLSTTPLVEHGQGPPAAATPTPAVRSNSVPTLDVVFTEDADAVYEATLGDAMRQPDRPLHVIYLRLFDNVTGTERFIAGPWRHLAFVHILESADQVTAEELAAAKDSGTVASMFIASESQLEDALRRQATEKWDEPMPDGFVARWRWVFNSERGRYPVRGLLCHGSFWRQAVDLLLVRMDRVVIDLTGYRPANAGTRFELQRVIDSVPISKLTLLAEHSSDRQFLTAQVRGMWAQMAAGSPNEGTGTRTVTVLVGG